MSARVQTAHLSVCSCPLLSSRLPPVETVQRNPELVLEGGPLAPLPHGDSFLETSIPVPALTWQDGPRQSLGCSECVYPPLPVTDVCLAAALQSSALLMPSLATQVCGTLVTRTWPWEVSLGDSFLYMMIIQKLKRP